MEFAQRRTTEFVMIVLILLGTSTRTASEPDRNATETSKVVLATSREELTVSIPSLPVLSEEEERLRRTALEKIAKGGCEELIFALEQLTSSKELFLRNCEDILITMLTRDLPDESRCTRLGKYAIAAGRIRSLPEGVYKNAVVDAFFTFRRTSAMRDEALIAFDEALFQSLFSSADSMQIIPEYGGWKMVEAFAENLAHENDEIRRSARFGITRIGALDAEKRSYVVSLIHENLLDDEASKCLYQMDLATRPEWDGIQASEYERLSQLSAEALSSMVQTAEVPRKYPLHLLMGTDERVIENYPVVLDLLRGQGEDYLRMGLKLAIPVGLDESEEAKQRMDKTLDYYGEILAEPASRGATPRWVVDALYRCSVLTDDNGRPRTNELGEVQPAYGTERTVGMMLGVLRSEVSSTAIASAKWLGKLSKVNTSVADRILVGLIERMDELKAPSASPDGKQELTKAIEKSIRILESSSGAAGNP